MANEWRCPKCGSRDYTDDQVSTTGNGLTRFFNVQTKRFFAVTCDRCSYTELYRTHGSSLSNIIDFFGN